MRPCVRTVPDCLSRAPSPEIPELSTAEEKLWIASKSLMQDTKTGEVKVDSKAISWQEESFHMPDVESIVTQILKWQAEDDHAEAGIKYCKDGEHPEKPYLQKWIKTIRFPEKKGLPGACAIFVPEMARETVLREAYTSLAGVHPDANKTLYQLRMHFYWPGQSSDVQKYCSMCLICAQCKGQGRPIRPPLKPVFSG